MKMSLEELAFIHDAIVHFKLAISMIPALLVFAIVLVV